MAGACSGHQGGLTSDDLFYYKNKPRVDAVAKRFQDKAGELAAAPGF